MSDSRGIARDVSRARAERLVAITRLLGHVFGVIAAVLTARDSRTFLPLAILLPWCAVSAVLLWSTYRFGRLFRPPLLLMLDLVLIAVVIGSTGGGTSPFFPLLLIPPFGANVLYARRGMLWAGIGTLATYLVVVLVATEHRVTDPRVVIIRLGVLVLIATVMIRRADHEQRTAADLESLANWPRVATAERDSGVRMLLEHAAATLRTDRLVMEWSEPDGSTYVARYESGGELTLERDEPAGLAGGIAFTSQTARGRLFTRGTISDPDDLRLAEIVARLVSSGLDQLNLVEMMRGAAGIEERLRLSRDLHDGLLQSLGGLALHVRGARLAVAGDPRSVEQRLDLVVDQLIEAQRALRDFVDGLRPELVQRRHSLRARLLHTSESIALQWNVAVDFQAAPEIDAVEMSLADELVALAGEALTNAARHAGATRIRGAAAFDGDTVSLDVEDDGHGFSFHGRYEWEQLAASGHAPWSLKERVAALGGALAIESTAHGSRVEIRLPRAS